MESLSPPLSPLSLPPSLSLSPLSLALSLSPHSIKMPTYCCDAHDLDVWCRQCLSIEWFHAANVGGGGFDLFTLTTTAVATSNRVRGSHLE